ncbi:MAG: hypothetical protein ACE15B_21495 [Bryobacteraceae bacterium]
MRRLRLFLLAGAAVCASGVLAWQTGLEAAGWTESDAPRIAKAFLIDTGVSQLPGSYLLKPAARRQLQALSGPERAKIVQQLARYAKSYVSAPAFSKTYDQWIASRYQAVNHGIQADAAADMAAFSRPGAVEDMQAQAAAMAAQTFLNLDLSVLKMMFPEDLKKWTRNPRDEKARKIAAKAQQIAPLLNSNPEAFKKEYALLKSMEMGGPDTWQGIEAASNAGAKTQAGAKAKQEQRAYNEHTLKVELKRRLQAFITLARSVDFAAQTRPAANRQVFVNPAYERKPDAWKMLYRLGKDPTMAAVAAAEAWLKEL